MKPRKPSKPRDVDSNEVILKATPVVADATVDVFYNLDLGFEVPLTRAKLRRIHNWLGRYLEWLESNAK